jgi:hypothetical protein
LEQVGSSMPVSSGAPAIRHEDLRYKRVEEALSRTFKVPEASLGAFRARLRNLRNMGIPNLPKSGSGTKIDYSRDQVIEILIALELSRLGIAPRYVGDIAKKVLERAGELAVESCQQASPGHHPTTMNEVIKEMFTSVADRVVAGPLPKGSPGSMLFVARPRAYDDLRAWALLREGKNLFLIVYPAEQLSSEEKYRWEVRSLTEGEILKVVEDHPSVAFVNLSSSIKALERHL